MTGKIPRLFEPMPQFVAESARNPIFSFHTLAGRPVVLAVIGSGQMEASRSLYKELADASQTVLRDGVICLVTFDPADRTQLKELPNLVVLHDETLAVGKLLGLVDADVRPGGPVKLVPAAFVLDERLRVFSIHSEADARQRLQGIFTSLQRLPRPGPITKSNGWAPVLPVPRIFEPELCRRLIAYYESNGGEPSGFMREREGRTFGVLDSNFKSRRDAGIKDDDLRQSCRGRLFSRLLPEIKRAFQFQVTHIERDIVACYDAGEGGYFQAHRDNTTKGTAHRRFAVTINLNAEGFEGGELRFPEFGTSSYRAETGGAIVFSCSLMHEALPVTRGRRFCYLPFLYDAAAAEIRQQNLTALDQRTYAPDGKTVLRDPSQTEV